MNRLRTPGSQQLRPAEPQYLAILYQLPPRSTRLGLGFVLIGAPLPDVS